MRRQPSGWDVRRRVVAVALAAALVLAPATMASAAALPGQAMYPFKRAIEQLRVASVQWSPPARRPSAPGSPTCAATSSAADPAGDVQPDRAGGERGHQRGPGRRPGRGRGQQEGEPVRGGRLAGRLDSVEGRWTRPSRGRLRPRPPGAAVSSDIRQASRRGAESRRCWSRTDPADRPPADARAQGVGEADRTRAVPARSPIPPRGRRLPTRRSPRTRPRPPSRPRPRRPSPSRPPPPRRRPRGRWRRRRSPARRARRGRGRGPAHDHPPAPRRRYPGAAPGP